MTAKKISNEQVLEAHAAYMADPIMTIKAQAQLHGLSRDGLRQRFRSLGLEIKPRRTGELNHNWNGGRSLNHEGYVKLRLEKSDPLYIMAWAEGIVLEHRYVMAQYLGRPLQEWETVHHIDGNRENNDITNLQLRIGAHGSGQEYYCLDCGSDRLSPKEI